MLYEVAASGVGENDGSHSPLAFISHKKKNKKEFYLQAHPFLERIIH